VEARAAVAEAVAEEVAKGVATAAAASAGSMGAALMVVAAMVVAATVAEGNGVCLRSSRYERHTRVHTGREKEASALRRRDAADGAKAAGSGVSRCASRAAATSKRQRGGGVRARSRMFESVVPNL